MQKNIFNQVTNFLPESGAIFLCFVKSGNSGNHKWPCSHIPFLIGFLGDFEHNFPY